MKEKYMAPDLCFEDFRLSQSIAVGCNTAVTNMLLADKYFATTGKLTNCENVWDQAKPPAGYEGYCYWDGAFNLLTS